jgi:Uncharacterized alpha/beta hydrolase domain (DUF2235)
MASRRIVLLLDGTWNDADFETNDTNIVRLRHIIARSLGSADPQSPEAQLTESLPPESQSPDAAVIKPKQGDFEYVVLYQRGVGTDTFLNRLLGGIGGDGLDINIRRAYRFLSFHYEPGDQIFIFGFSRGSFTARSLVGYVTEAGLLHAEHCTEDNERAAWDYYRAPPSERLPGVWYELKKHVHDREKLRIECIGVFDTVGALGIPVQWFDRANRERYEFHNVELSMVTNTNLHALAIDEHREPFRASVWRKPPFGVLKTETEQVWFVGAHANIGGGAVDARARTEVHRELDDITLDWMIRRVKQYYPNFPVSAWTGCENEARQATQNQSRRGIYRLLPYAWRAIANIEVKLRWWHLYQECVSCDRHDLPIMEMIHISAIERLGCPVFRDNWIFRTRYRPRNLVAILPVLRAVYGGEPPKAGPIRIVDWDGSILSEQNPAHCRKAMGEIAAATKRLGIVPKAPASTT